MAGKRSKKSSPITKPEKSITPEEFDINKIPSSKETFGDPTLYETLQWHMSLCHSCTRGRDQPPPAFGTRDNRHCIEYYEIVEEYSEYERDYIRWGNP